MSKDAGGHPGSAQGGPSSEECDGEDEESSSLNLSELILDDSRGDASNDNHDENVETALSNFRQKWQRELESPLKTNKRASSPRINNNNAREISLPKNQSSESDEEKAKNLFLKGVEFEKSGELYEAIKFYKRAVQLVPDIEQKIYESAKLKTVAVDDASVETKDDRVPILNEKNDETEELDTEDFTLTIEKKVYKSDLICFPEREEKCKHISSLPIELLMYILRWIVSSDLDMISLERFASVCCGFYICARDPEIWRLACIRTWGIHCGIYKALGYNSWRHMFIDRPRLRFNGCYISKTSYVRPGENSFQDQFYRPWHLVKYFRYLRFFPDGIVLMMTTPDEPITCLDRLKQRNSKVQGVLSGHYRLSGDKVAISVGMVANNPNKTIQSTNTRFRPRRRDNTSETTENTFHLELQLKSHHPHMFCSLVWRSYTVFAHNKSTGAFTQTSFEIVKSKFPSFKFSQVNRFHAKTDSPLQ